jgi:hypothetical protein
MANSTIASGGVLPNINQSLLPNKPKEGNEIEA